MADMSDTSGSGGEWDWAAGGPNWPPRPTSRGSGTPGMGTNAGQGYGVYGQARPTYGNRHSLFLAGYGSRVGGYIADFVITFVIGIALNLLGMAAGGPHSGPLVGPVLVIAFNLWYQVGLIGGSQGATWGMRFVGIAVVDANTNQRPIGYGRAFLRGLLAGIASFLILPAILDFLWPLWDPRNQTLHDKVANTIVVRHRI